MQSSPTALPGHDPKLTRLAGALYLVIILCGVWSEGFARAQLIFPSDTAATFAALKARPGLLGLSIAADTVMALADVALAVLFLHLLRPLGPILATCAAALRLVQAAVIAASLILLAGVFPLLAGPETGLAAQFAAMHGAGYDIGLIFFGVNSLLMAVLLRRAGDVPRPVWLGVAAAGLVYLTGSYLRLLAPGLHATFQIAYLVPLLAETALCLWLLVTGRLIADRPG